MAIIEMLGEIGTMAMTKRKIGFLMGSFDPMHIGHVGVIRNVISNGLADKVIVVPCFQNPWKKNTPAPFEKRIEIINIQTAWFGEKVEVSDVEGFIEAPYYSYKTLSKLKGQYPDDELFIVCGTDVAESIHLWKNYETDIKPYFGIIVIDRNDMSVSSTNIRELLKNKIEVYPYLTENALKYIKKEKLYE